MWTRQAIAIDDESGPSKSQVKRSLAFILGAVARINHFQQHFVLWGLGTSCRLLERRSKVLPRQTVEGLSVGRKHSAHCRQGCRKSSTAIIPVNEFQGNDPRLRVFRVRAFSRRENMSENKYRPFWAFLIIDRRISMADVDRFFYTTL